MVTRWPYFMLSLLLHLGLIAVMVVHASLSHYGNAHEQVMSSYLVTFNSQRDNLKISDHHLQNAIHKQIYRSNFLSPAVHHVAHAATRSYQHHSLRSHQLTPGERSQLLLLLHDAIRKHLIYPEQAIEMQMTGQVTLNFNLSKEGVISKISIQRASHYAILDEAAMQSLRTISPFLKAKNYLRHTTNLSVLISYDSE